MKTDTEKRYLDNLLQKAAYDADVLAVILFGSKAAGKGHKLSDIDICIVLRPGKHSPNALSHKKIEYLMQYYFDINIYQQLPIYIRQRIIKEGRVLFCRDEDALYEVAFKTMHEFEDYRNVYYEYLKEVANA